MDEIQIAGFGGQVFLTPTYLLEIQIHDLPPHSIEVIAHDEEPFILLGRDLLNHHRIVLDGPNLSFEIS